MCECVCAPVRSRVGMGVCMCVCVSVIITVPSHYESEGQKSGQKLYPVDFPSVKRKFPQISLFVYFHIKIKVKLQ